MKPNCLETNLNRFLAEVIAEAKNAGIPVSKRINSHVVVNQRAKKRLGCCIKKGKDFTIEISAYLIDAPDFICKTILMHEVLHTCRDCQNHGPVWKNYAAIVNHQYGYQIKRTSSWESLGLQNPSGNAGRNGENRTGKIGIEEVGYHYVLQCIKCGAVIKRKRRSRVIQHPELYRCRCGGKLKRMSEVKG